jgi:uncharacterized repeat protein (TIGR03943 family)
MKRRSEITITIGLGLAAGSLLRSGIYLRYVRPAMYPLLAAAAVTLVAIGLASLLKKATPLRHGDDHQDAGPRDEDPHPEHRHRLNAGWLLVIPMLVALVPPPALGASSIGRIAALTLTSGSYTQPIRPGIPALTLSEFATRAIYGHSLADRDVVLEGFSTPSPSGGWNLTRLVIVCCAADALAIQVHVDGAPNPGTSTWVRVTGRWQPASAGVPAIQAAQVTITQQPNDPYE